MDFSFLQRLTDSLQKLFGGQSKAAEPLKIATPISADAQKEAERQAKRKEYIKRGWTFPNMTAEEKAIPTYVPTATPAPSATPTPTPQAMPTQPPVATDQQISQEIEGFLNTQIFPVTRKFGIPDALAASQWAVESGRLMQNVQNNVFGLMGQNGLIPYPSLESNVQDYGRTVENIAAKKGLDLNENGNAFDILMALQQGDKPRYEAHNADPIDYVRTVINTPEWRRYFR